MQKETQPKKTNGLPPEAGTHKLRRTLLLAGVFALLAMIYVPAPGKPPFGSAHYRFIFSQHETGIAFFQLLVNVVFAAALGAIAANLSKRALRVIFGCIIVIVAGVGVFRIARQYMEAAVSRAQADERYASYLLDYSADDAATYFKNAAANWRLALDFGDANRAEATAGDTLRLMLYREEKRGEKAEQARRQAEEQAVEQAKQAEIAEENVKRARANQAWARKAFSEFKLTLAQDYYRAAARCWHSANHYDLEEECMREANRIEWLISEGVIDRSK